MRTSLKGFSLFEVILYLGIFSVMATALLQFSWNIMDLGAKDKTARRVFSDARFLTERVNFFIRNAEGIDEGASLLNEAAGKLVLSQVGSSDTVTLEVQGEKLWLTETGGAAVALHGIDSRVQSLEFSVSGSEADGSEYVGYTLVLESARNDEDVRSPYEMTTTIQSGAFVRNSQAGL
jgi:hypothetical protein